MNQPPETTILHFPGTRYMGSKAKILPAIWNATKNIKFESVLDAFSGSGVVSYLFKRMGKKVYSNDFLKFDYYISQALIENSNVTLGDSQVDKLVQRRNKNSFIQKRFSKIYFSDSDNALLDRIRGNIDGLQDPYMKALALSALARACIKKRPRGIFTYVGQRYDDGRKDLTTTLEEHFREGVRLYNEAVYSNGRNSKAYNLDVFDVNVNVDLVYFDPPYFTQHSDNDYTRRYHFVEGLVRNWDGVKIQEHTRTKKIESFYSPFMKRGEAYLAFEKLFRKYKKSILVVSYSSNSLPKKSELISMLKKYKSSVKAIEVDHVYSFGNQGFRIDNNRNRVKEFLFIAQ